jgi:hypothetical protein
MKKTVQNKTPSTQKFIGIEDIENDIVVLPGRQACQIIEVTATNFALQSLEDQEVKILSYASLLNSLSFPIQIIIISRKLNISNYLNVLEDDAKKSTNPKLTKHIQNYRNFVADLVKNNDVLDKKFYISIPYSFLEKGAGKAGSAKDKDIFIQDARNILNSKSGSILQELNHIGLIARILRRDELIRLFYEIYNQEEPDQRLIDAFHTTHVQGVRR